MDLLEPLLDVGVVEPEVLPEAAQRGERVGDLATGLGPRLARDRLSVSFGGVGGGWWGDVTCVNATCDAGKPGTDMVVRGV